MPTPPSPSRARPRWSDRERDQGRQRHGSPDPATAFATLHRPVHPPLRGRPAKARSWRFHPAAHLSSPFDSTDRSAHDEPTRMVGLRSSPWRSLVAPDGPRADGRQDRPDRRQAEPRQGEHEFNAGTKLLVEVPETRSPASPRSSSPAAGPSDESVFDGAKAVVFFMDGGGGHPIIQGDHLAKIKKLMDKGVGLALMHYAVEIPKDKGGARVPGMDRRLLRVGLLDQPPLGRRDQIPPRPPDHPRRQAVRDQRRVVL